MRRGRRGRERRERERDVLKHFQSCVNFLSCNVYFLALASDVDANHVYNHAYSAVNL